VGILILLFFCLEVGWSQYYQAISLFLHLQFHFTAEKIGFFSANMGIVMAVGLLIVYPILLRMFSVKNIMRSSMIFVLIGSIVCAIVSTPTIQWIFSSVIALFTGIAYVSLTALISDKVPDNAQGFSMGYLSAILYFSWMITSFASGFLMKIHPQLPFVVAAIALLIACCSFVLKKRQCLAH
jgi:MFS family permease